MIKPRIRVTRFPISPFIKYQLVNGYIGDCPISMLHGALDVEILYDMMRNTKGLNFR